MKYDFDKIIDRRGTNSLKYDFSAERGVPENALPMWVADMDFAVPDEVLLEIQKVAAHGIFGYTDAKADYYDAVINWFGSHFNYTVKPEEIVKSPGIVFALAHAVRAFTSINDAVMVQPPVYYPFYHVILDNDRKLVTNPLKYENGTYHIDFEDFERKAAEFQVKLFILCSPHNPVGRVFTREELQKLHEICRRYDILVISDEIHCDFTLSGHEHTMYGHIDEHAVICTAPSKTFNLAGLQISNIFIKDGELRQRLCAEINRSGYCEINTLGLTACKSAYTHGEPWLRKLKLYLSENLQLVRSFLAEKLPKIKLVEPEGTYLIWLDFKEYGLPQEELDRRITEGAGLWLDGGTMFGAEGEGFQRINIACPRTTVEEALQRLYKEFHTI